jgi:hypothetical protein
MEASLSLSGVAFLGSFARMLHLISSAENNEITDIAFNRSEAICAAPILENLYFEGFH